MHTIRENLQAYIIQQLSTNGLVIAKKVAIALWIFFLWYFVAKIVVSWSRKKIEENHLGNHNDIEKVSKLVSSILYSSLMILNFFLVLQVLGIDVAILMWGISLWFAFALQTIIANMIAGIMIVLNKKFTIGDMISIEWSLKVTGIIENITLRYTVIKTFDRRKTIVPNTTLAKTPFKTIKSEKYIRWDIEFSVPRHVNIQQVKSLLVQMINNNEDVVRKEFSNCIIKKFDEKGIVLKAFFLVDPKVSATGFGVKKALKSTVLDVFKQYGISAPYFHITLDIEK